MDLEYPSNDYEVDIETPNCVYQLGWPATDGRIVFDEKRGLLFGAAISCLNYDYDSFKASPGFFGRVTQNGLILLLWNFPGHPFVAPAWYGTDQAFGNLCKLRNWAEVAFFTMCRDDDIADVTVPASWLEEPDAK